MRRWSTAIFVALVGIVAILCVLFGATGKVPTILWIIATVVWAWMYNGEKNKRTPL